MPRDLLLIVIGVFMSAALIFGGATALVLSRVAPGRRRLKELLEAKSTSGLLKDAPSLTARAEPVWDSLIKRLPMRADARLIRDLTLAGYHGTQAVTVYLMSQPVLAVLCGLGGLFAVADSRRWVLGLVGAMIGYVAPSFVLGRMVRKRQREIENGLADALDLLVLCLEAGSSLDMAIVKATEELQVSYPTLAEQFRILISEMRAGKPRLEAFRGFAQRSKVDDARALVAMLVQTDRFGTSVAQALRTHASVCRTKRRQRAEERAEKVGVKLVFPLVFCLFPALFVILLGPAVIQFARVFSPTP